MSSPPPRKHQRVDKATGYPIVEGEVVTPISTCTTTAVPGNDGGPGEAAGAHVGIPIMLEHEPRLDKYYAWIEAVRKALVDNAQGGLPEMLSHAFVLGADSDLGAMATAQQAAIDYYQKISFVIDDYNVPPDIQELLEQRFFLVMEQLDNKIEPNFKDLTDIQVRNSYEALDLVYFNKCLDADFAYNYRDVEVHAAGIPSGNSIPVKLVEADGNEVCFVAPCSDTMEILKCRYCEKLGFGTKRVRLFWPGGNFIEDHETVAWVAEKDRRKFYDVEVQEVVTAVNPDPTIITLKMVSRDGVTEVMVAHRTAVMADVKCRYCELRQCVADDVRFFRPNGTLITPEETTARLAKIKIERTNYMFLHFSDNAAGACSFEHNQITIWVNKQLFLNMPIRHTREVLYMRNLETNELITSETDINFWQDTKWRETKINGETAFEILGPDDEPRTVPGPDKMYLRSAGGRLCRNRRQALWYTLMHEAVHAFFMKYARMLPEGNAACRKPWCELPEQLANHGTVFKVLLGKLFAQHEIVHKLHQRHQDKQTKITQASSEPFLNGTLTPERDSHRALITTKDGKMAVVFPIEGGTPYCLKCTTFTEDGRRNTPTLVPYKRVKGFYPPDEDPGPTVASGLSADVTVTAEGAPDENTYSVTLSTDGTTQLERVVSQDQVTMAQLKTRYCDTKPGLEEMQVRFYDRDHEFLGPDRTVRSLAQTAHVTVTVVPGTDGQNYDVTLSDKVTQESVRMSLDGSVTMEDVIKQYCQNKPLQIWQVQCFNPNEMRLTYTDTVESAAVKLGARFYDRCVK